MSRLAVSQLLPAAGFSRRLECEAQPPANALDGLLAELAGPLLMRLADLARPLRRLQARRLQQRATGLAALDDAALQQRVALARQRLRRQGPQGAALDEALALASEAAWRSLGQRPHAVQLMGARALVQGRLVEMATGEGKTLTAALAACVLAGSGLPVDVYTVNDYLARRDAQLLQPLYRWFGLGVAWVDGAPGSQPRREAYAADVVYLVNKDGVFDFLRHRQASRHEPFAGRGLFVALVDEADSILIDEARTPLILARERAGDAAPDLDSLLALATDFQPGEHFELQLQERRVDLLPLGRAALRDWSRQHPATPPPQPLAEELLRQALAALHLYRRDQAYVLRDGKVQIVDEFTGRILADRSWQRGLHQFIERKEGLAPSAPRETLARITYPQFFRKYLRLAGMSGTMAETAGELRRHYGVQVLRVPTHRPVQRRLDGPRLYASAEQRWQAVVQAAQQAAHGGRAVLIGTRSVLASETVAAHLAQAGVPARVLNARQDQAEAELIAQAGQPGRITVATNMAGRGTDIVIDATVRAAGGLLVVLTEFHESTRIDRQLFGRCARQGDPGSVLALASLDDELLTAAWPPALLAALRRLSRPGQPGRPFPRPLARLLLGWAQHRASARQRAERDATLAAEDLLRQQLALPGDGT
ncbi:MAG: preprotein translocase subunit SecA [Burkholderiaceae bacterium]|nr:preprotein translocase subunit SecA [Burkholderiaceae bacterium]